MGCQMESHGAALKAYQVTYGRQDLFVCGLDRQEHPYDVEDYVRHFGVRFPVFVDLGEESSRDCRAGLDGVVVLDAKHRPVRPEQGDPMDPLQARVVLQKLFGDADSGADRRGDRQPVVHGAAGTALSPQIAQPGWSDPAQLGLGRYPRVVAYGTNRAVCVWVAGEVPAQRILFSVFDGQNWQAARPVPAGEDAHAPALDAGSRPVMAWSQKEGKSYRVFSSTLAGAEWSKPLAISPAGNDAFRPDMYCTAGGETVVAWYGWKRVQLRDYPNSWWRSIYVTTLAGGAPGPIRELAKLERGSDDCWDPVITGAAGGLQVSWLRDENPPLLFCSARTADGWSAQKGLLPIKRAPQTFCSVRAASPVKKPGSRDGLVFELNLDSGDVPSLRHGIHVYAQRRTVDGWSQPVVLSSGPGRHLAPVAVEDSTGARLVFWWDLEGGKATVRLCSLSGTWSQANPSELLVGGDCRNLYPAACADAAGRVWLAWQAEHRGDASAIFAARRLAPR
jgi:hypothetical protein